MIAAILIFAAAASGTTPSAPKPAANNNERVVCQTFPPPVGTRLGERRICKTVAEWRLESAVNKEVLDRKQTQLGLPGG
jgi:hypothetical protein